VRAFTTSFAQVASQFVTIKNSLSVPIIPLAEVPLTPRWRVGRLQAGLR
jgi:hypothetical protein